MFDAFDTTTALFDFVMKQSQLSLSLSIMSLSPEILQKTAYTNVAATGSVPSGITHSFVHGQVALYSSYFPHCSDTVMLGDTSVIFVDTFPSAFQRESLNSSNSMGILPILQIHVKHIYDPPFIDRLSPSSLISMLIVWMSSCSRPTSPPWDAY